MESCFRFNILGFVFGIYLYFFAFQTVWCPNDGQTLCEQNVSDCFIATYGLPKSCVCAQGVRTSVKRGRLVDGQRAMRPPAFCPPALASPPE